MLEFNLKAERKPPLYNMNAMSALYHIAQNDSPTLSSTPVQQQTASGDTAPPPTVAWSDNFKHFISLCLKKQPTERSCAADLLDHQFIVELSDRQALIELIRKTKEAVRNLDNMQNRKLKNIMMVDGGNSSSSGGNGMNGSNNGTNLADTTSSSMTPTSRDRGGSESGGSSLLNLKHDGSETSRTSHGGFDASSQLDDYDNDDDYENANATNNTRYSSFKCIKRTKKTFSFL